MTIPTYIHPDIAEMTTDEINNLKGETLKTIAVKCEIKGRSTMKADDLRNAIATVITGYRNAETAEILDNNEDRGQAMHDIAGRPDDVDFAENVLDDNALYGPAPMPGPSSEVIDVVSGREEVDEWKTYLGREARRKAARKQRKAQGRIAQKQNRNIR